MKKKFLSLILAVILSITVCIPSLAENTATILFQNNSETIELVFSGVTAQEAVSEIVRDGTTIPLYELTILPGSTFSEILPPYAVGRHSIIAEDANGMPLTLDGGTYTDMELESLIFTYLMQKEILQQQIAAALLTGINTAALEAALKDTDDAINQFLTLRENLKKAMTITTSLPSNPLNTTISRETVFEFIREGTYILWFRPHGAVASSMAVKLNITDEIPSNPLPEPTPEPVPETPLSAIPTQSTVFVNGVKSDFDAFNISGNNYFKLRDLAFVLSGTVKQFEVIWDGDAGIIKLLSGLPYTPVGGEMSPKSSQNKTPVPTDATILLDGSPVYFTAFNIDGNNYFKLRDIGSAFDFNVSYNAEDSSVIVDTSETYTDD